MSDGVGKDPKLLEAHRDRLQMRERLEEEEARQKELDAHWTAPDWENPFNKGARND